MVTRYCRNFIQVEKNQQTKTVLSKREQLWRIMRSFRIRVHHSKKTGVGLTKDLLFSVRRQMIYRITYKKIPQKQQESGLTQQLEQPLSKKIKPKKFASEGSQNTSEELANSVKRVLNPSISKIYTEDRKSLLKASMK